MTIRSTRKILGGFSLRLAPSGSASLLIVIVSTPSYYFLSPYLSHLRAAVVIS